MAIYPVISPSYKYWFLSAFGCSPVFFDSFLKKYVVLSLSLVFAGLLAQKQLISYNQKENSAHYFRKLGN